MSGLVLSIFPGIDLLGRAFEEVGFCVVRGPDLIWGGDIHTFHPPMDTFDGIIGGPPCQSFSPLAAFGNTQAVDLIPEFERCVDEAWPDWFLMENVEAAPEPSIDAYAITSMVLDNRWVGGEQRRRRRFTFGVYKGDGWRQPIDLAPLIGDYVALEPAAVLAPVTSSHGGGKGRYAITRYSALEATLAQGLPARFLEGAPFTAAGKLKAIANGVPLPLGRAIARAVQRALWEKP